MLLHPQTSSASLTLWNFRDPLLLFLECQEQPYHTQSLEFLKKVLTQNHRRFEASTQTQPEYRNQPTVTQDSLHAFQQGLCAFHLFLEVFFGPCESQRKTPNSEFRVWSMKKRKKIKTKKLGSWEESWRKRNWGGFAMKIPDLGFGVGGWKREAEREGGVTKGERKGGKYLS